MGEFGVWFFFLLKKNCIFCDSLLLDSAVFGLLLLNYLLGPSRVNQIIWITGSWPWRYFWLVHADIWCWRCIRNYLTRKGKQKETWPYDTSLLRCAGVVAGTKELSKKATWKLQAGTVDYSGKKLESWPWISLPFKHFLQEIDLIRSILGWVLFYNYQRHIEIYDNFSVALVFWIL